MSETSPWCGSCEISDLNVQGSHWCNDCKKVLCIQCLEHHKMNETSRQHHVIEVDVLHNESHVTNECEAHGREIEFYCLDHEDAACITCVKDSHKKCDRVQPFKDLVTNYKEKEIMNDMRDTLKSLQNSLEEFRKFKEGNLQNIQKQKRMISMKMRNERLRLNEHLNTLEAKFQSDLAGKCKEIADETKEMIVKTKSKQEKLNAISSSIEQLEQTDSQTQTFVAVKRLEKELTKEQNDIGDIFHDSALNVSLKYKPEPLIGSPLSASSCGDIERETSLKQFHVRKLDDQRAQTVVVREIIRKMSEVELDQVNTFTVSDSGPYGKRITDCVILPAERIVIVDFQNDSISMYTENGELQKCMNVGSGPFSLSVIDDNIVVVSCSKQKILQIVNLDTCEIENEFPTENHCFGVSVLNKNIYVLVQERGIVSYSQNGEMIRTIPIEIPAGSKGYLACNENGIWYTCTQSFFKNFAKKIDWDGTTIWHSEDGDSGVAVDRHGNCFVTKVFPSMLNGLSLDGTREKTFPDALKGLCMPGGMFLDETRDLLLVVTDCSGTLSLFSIK